MSYEFEPGEAAGDGARRIAREQLDKALAELADESLNADDTVHQVRKRCKKLRALLRLARGDLDKPGVYKRENTAIRDASRLLTDVRDARALVETLDDLLDTFSSQANLQRMSPVRRALEERRDEVATHRMDLDARFREVSERLQAVRARVDDWPVGEGFGALAPGLKRSYERGRLAMVRAHRRPTTEHFHEWRKRVKYHRYHLRMLEPCWEGPLKQWKKASHELSDLLGDDHDLAVLAQTLASESDRFPSKRDVQSLLGLADRRRAQLQARTAPLGARLYADKPKYLARRLGVFWSAAQDPIELGSSEIQAEVMMQSDS